MNRKGIILAGGYGTRLYPATSTLSKQLLPVYDKPMIYYPLSTLILAGLKEILIITQPQELHLFQKLLSDGKKWGIHLTYAVQDQPRGIAEAFIIGEDFMGDDSVCLMLGDNILYGQGVSEMLQASAQQTQGATVFGYYVNDPERYGVIYFDEKHQPVEIVEKPMRSLSNYAAIGIYFYDNDVVSYAKKLKPSVRGELEITDISNEYLLNKNLHVQKLGRGVAWLDTGTPVSWLEASNYIQILESRQGLKIGCPEEAAWRMNLIDDQQLLELAAPLLKSGYGTYLQRLVES